MCRKQNIWRNIATKQHQFNYTSTLHHNAKPEFSTSNKSIQIESKKKKKERRPWDRVGNHVYFWGIKKKIMLWNLGDKQEERTGVTCMNFK